MQPMEKKMELAEIQKALQDRRPCIVARATGLHRNIISRVRDNAHAIEPRPETIRKLSAYLEQRK